MRFACLAAAAVFCILPAVADASDKPNIVYINADDLGIMDVGYNNPKYRTPNIDRLAREGMTFTDGYAPAANCAPSRACVFSGQWSPRHGVYTVGNSDRGKSSTRKLIPIANRIHLPPEVVTLAQALKAGGYRTIHLGKYHISPDPLEDGFEVNVGGDHTGGPAGGYFSPWKSGSMAPWSERVPPKTHRIDIFVAEAVKFIQAHRDEPMFIHFSPYLIHTPFQAVPEYVDRYDDSVVDPVYASMVEKLDEAVGKLMEALDQHGLRESTLVVFCSDNGGICAQSSQAPYRAGKGSYYDGGIREPLIMRWPGRIQPGSKCDEPVNALNFYPTFLEAAGLETPSGVELDGVSMLPLMLQTGQWTSVPQFWHFPVYLQAYRPGQDDGRDPLFRTRPGSAMRWGKWKLHEYFEDGALELYDLKQDPGERKDLSKYEPEKTAELHRMLIDWRQRVNAPVPTKLNPDYRF